MKYINGMIRTCAALALIVIGANNAFADSQTNPAGQSGVQRGGETQSAEHCRPDEFAQRVFVGGGQTRTVCTNIRMRHLVQDCGGSDQDPCEWQETCPAATVSWDQCQGPVSRTAVGQERNATNNRPNYSGFARFRCNADRSWTQDGTSSCTPEFDPCTNQSVSWGSGCTGQFSGGNHGARRNVPNETPLVTGQATYECQNGTPVLITQTCGDESSDPSCGDGVCESSETLTCPADCAGGGGTCGDGRCDAGEAATCPLDCSGAPPVSCGDGICGAGENATSCAVDCVGAPACGDGTCQASESTTSCPVDCSPTINCGNGRCESGETSGNCPIDCPLGSGCDNDGICEAGEGPTSCPGDCGPSVTPPPPPTVDCGNGRCDAGETGATCPIDCDPGTPDPPPPPTTNCDRDGRCEAGENSTNCPVDCPPSPPTTQCGDGVCNGAETQQSCPVDCFEQPSPPPVSCGDGICNGTETQQNCPRDCDLPDAPDPDVPNPDVPDPPCGDGVCQTGETAQTCQIDCGPPEICGNLRCEIGENALTCPEDCGSPAPVSCGNGRCETGENGNTCPRDCGGSGGGGNPTPPPPDPPPTPTPGGQDDCPGGDKVNWGVGCQGTLPAGQNMQTTNVPGRARKPSDSCSGSKSFLCGSGTWRATGHENCQCTNGGSSGIN